MIKLVSHSPIARTQLGRLVRRAEYLGDAKHRNHIGKTITGLRNIDCIDQSALALRVEVEIKFEDYLFFRSGKRGKRTSRRWEELIYSSPPSTQRDENSNVLPCLDERERDIIEQAILAGPVRGCPARLAWHIDLETGRCDLHILVSEINELNVVWVNHEYGHGKKNLKLELERVEEEALDIINRNRDLEHKIPTPRQVHARKRKSAGKETLAEKLARAGWDGDVSSLLLLLRELGYKIIKNTAKRIWVQAKTSSKTIAYGLATLTKNWQLARTKTAAPKSPDKASPKPSQTEIGEI